MELVRVAASAVWPATSWADPGVAVIVVLRLGSLLCKVETEVMVMHQLVAVALAEGAAAAAEIPAVIRSIRRRRQTLMQLTIDPTETVALATAVVLVLVLVAPHESLFARDT